MKFQRTTAIYKQDCTAGAAVYFFCLTEELLKNTVDTKVQRCPA